MFQGLRRFAFWLTLVPLSFVLIVLALANRQPVLLAFNPFSMFGSTAGTEMPLFLALFAFFILGACCGSVLTWNSQRPWRHAVKRQAKEIEALRDEITLLKHGPREDVTKPDWQILPPL